jgi:hypothetical protein
MPPSGVQASGWYPAGNGSMPAPPSPYSLDPGTDDDAALFQDARIGFSHLLPGRPSLAMARPGAPTADATVQLHDVPVTIRYKLEAPSVRAPSSAELVRLTAERFASWRAQGAVRAEFANPSWLLAWGADAAVVSTYDVAPVPGAEQPAREDLFVLFRQGGTYLVTWTFPREFTDDPTYASFASVAEATMVWDPMRWEQRGRVWPESPFVGSGLRAQPKAKYQETARWLAEIVLSDAERSNVNSVLAGLASNAGAPWVELRPDVLERSGIALRSAFRSPEVQAFLQTAFAEVKTAHDLRGLAVLLGRAFSQRPSRPISARPSRT